MTVQAHLESLQKKHVALEEELHALMNISLLTRY